MHIIYYTLLILYIKKCIGLSIEQSQYIADQISLKFHNLLKTSTKYEHLQNKYEQQYKENITKIEKLDVPSVSLHFKNNLEKLLLKHISTSLDIKEAAEKLYSNYTYDPNIATFNYFNRKQLNPVQITPTFSLTKEININKSYCQVPTDIFRNDKKILNDAKWTLPLNDVYLANMEKIPSLLWQYFGIESGMFRSFPGKNTAITAKDYYDCRRRLWYSQAINSPKDILIAVDLSGSMTGSHSDIAQVTIKSLIDTLQQNDFFNVIYYNSEEVNFVLKSCSNQKLFQATSQNKDMFKTAVDDFPAPRGQSSIFKLLEEAFRVLKVSKTSQITSSTCNQAIMLISDGIESDEDLDDGLSEWNAGGDVIIFSYIIGSGGTKDKEMRKLACDNGGEFYHFPTIGNVWNGVLKYQKIFSKPVAGSKNMSIIFTPLYLDSGGLGMMTTISAPVFSKIDNQTLLGVAGVDITLTLLELQYPVKSLGVFGHAFAINNNGLFLIHPNFRDQRGYLPDPATVFLNDIEYTVNKSISLYLMKELIDQKTGCLITEVDWMYGKQQLRVLRQNVTYCYNPVNETPFRSGVSIPLRNQNISKVVEENVAKYFVHGVNGLSVESPFTPCTKCKQWKHIETANWLFCDIDSEKQINQPVSIRFYPTAKEIQKHLQTNNYSKKCDKELLFPLLLSSSIVSNFTNEYWQTEKLLDSYNISQIYLITTSGFITYIDRNNKTNFDLEIFDNEKFTHPASYAITSNDITTLTVSVPIKTQDRKTKPTASVHDIVFNVAIGLYASKHHILESIIGVEISNKNIEMLFEETTKSLQTTSIFQNNKELINCSDTMNYQCYLIDENAYTIYSNQYKHDIGIFYGFVNGFLMRLLITKGLYIEKRYNDTQAQCENTYILVNNDDGQTTEKIVKKNETCTKQRIIHTRTQNKTLFNGYYNLSSECGQSFNFIPIKQTNMALIIIKTKTCSLLKSNFILNNEPIQVNKSSVCGHTLSYRKSIDKCFKLTKFMNKCENIDNDGADAKLKTYITIISSFSTFALLIFFIMCS